MKMAVGSVWDFEVSRDKSQSPSTALWVTKEQISRRDNVSWADHC